MNRKRLLRGRAVIEEKIAQGVKPTEETVQPGGGEQLFNIRTWGLGDECGTVACGGGYMACDPELRAEGLRARADILAGSRSLAPVYEPDGYQGHHLPEGQPALTLFFDISPNQTDHIFSSLNTNTLPSLLKRIDDVLEGRVK